MNKYHTDSFKQIFKPIIKGDLLIDVPQFKGTFIMDVRSHITKRILRDKYYEPNLVACSIQYINPNTDVIDVGANIGLYTILYSKLISENNKVLSIEPVPEALIYFKKNLENNKCNNNVILYEGAATIGEGVININTIPGNIEYSSIGSIVHNAVKNMDSISIKVNSNSIDNLVLINNLNPGFIKIDAEGAEYSILAGCQNTLEKYKPVILFELDDKLLEEHGANSTSVLKILEKFGYKLINVNKPNNNIKYPFTGEVLAINNIR
jgi:FkbM family methyltransferase